MRKKGGCVFHANHVAFGGLCVCFISYVHIKKFIMTRYVHLYNRTPRNNCLALKLYKYLIAREYGLHGLLSVM